MRRLNSSSHPLRGGCLTDLAEWYAFSHESGGHHAGMMEACFGGPPDTPERVAQYRRRSPLFILAQAKGLPDRMIERRYILRPTLPIIVTSFALTLISVWTGAIVLETIFNWPGLGRLLYQAIGIYDTPVIVGSVVIYAYLLALTVFLLDIIYAWLDPRVKVGEGGGSR